MENKVYIVTSGEYSDYTIERVFSTAKQAKEYCDRFDDSYRVKAFTVDDVLPPREESLFWIKMQIGTKKIQEVSIRSGDQDGKIQVDTRGAYIYLGIKTDSKKRAIKIASERYDQVFAHESTKYPYLRTDIVKVYGVRTTPTYDFVSGDIILDAGELACKLPPYIKIRRPPEDPMYVEAKIKAQADAQELSEALRRSNEQAFQAASEEAAQMAKRSARRAAALGAAIKQPGGLESYITERVAAIRAGMELKNVKKDGNLAKLEFDYPE